MVKENRHESLYAVVTSTSSDSAAEFRNDSAEMMHIRGIETEVELSGVEADEGARVEVSKSPAMAHDTNNSPFFTFPTRLGSAGSTTGAAVDDAMWTKSKGKRWPRGALTLEPNESLFMNVAKDAGGTVRAWAGIEYEY